MTEHDPGTIQGNVIAQNSAFVEDILGSSIEDIWYACKKEACAKPITVITRQCSAPGVQLVVPNF